VIQTLPFKEIWAVDFEYIAPEGGRPVPVCMVAKELRSGELLRVWQDDLPSHPPFRTDEAALFVSYLTPAELKCFIELGWPMPARILDLYVEFRARTSGMRNQGRSLLDALTFYGLPHITKAEKEAGRALVMRGGPWDESRRRAILEYCQTDVDPLEPLLERMLPRIRARKRGLGQALLRGRYMAAVSHMEMTGIPVDVPTLTAIRTRKESIKLDVVREIDAEYGVYDGTTFKQDRFEAMLSRRGVIWHERTPTGGPKLEEKTFKAMCDSYPWLHPLRELRDFLGKLKLESLVVGDDGRNRTTLWPFASKTGRNQPSNAEYIYGPGRWIRHLIKPEEGRAVAYIDWSLQEFAIAAALSGDAGMLEVLDTGDMYLEFAKLAGWAPPEATKATHKLVRDRCKPIVLALNYGMQVDALALRMGSSRHHADSTMQAFARRFSTYWAWAEARTEQGSLRGTMASCFGWPMTVSDDTRPNTLRNFPMQSNGAEMLRLACSLATERGIEVCGPVHDAILVEGTTSTIEDVVARTRDAMSEASRAVLKGFEVKTDVEITRWPDRCTDGRGSELWARILAQLERPQ
jgi:DNA polymerase I-like protein with 3'-5' exonuclease and polymerase domains